MLSKKIQDAGVRVYRSPKAIKCKISNIEDMFKEAHDWAHQTGVGVREEDPGQFNDYIKQKCPYYFDLIEVMQDRATARPQLTSDSIDGDDNNDDNDDECVIERSATPPIEMFVGVDDESVTSRSLVTVPSVPNSGRKKPAKGRTKQDVDEFASIQMQAMTEAVRHHKRMEDLRQKELDCAQQEYEHKERISNLTVQQMELKLKLSQVEAYEKIKGTLSTAVIKKFPELAEYIDSDSE